MRVHDSLRVRCALALTLAGCLLAPATLLAANADVAVELPTAAPSDVGMSAERLERIDRRMAEAVDNGEMAGALALVSRHGKVVYAETWGDRDRENGVPMTMDTIFRIYSMTKPVTSVATMMLYEEGRFFLNDPVSKYLPEYAEMEVATVTADGEGEKGERRPAERPMTIRDLLRHTAGFTYGFFGNTEVDQLYRSAGLLMVDDTLAEFSEKLADLPLQYDPGERFHYSVSVDVLGRLVEVVSGMPFEDFLEERIFEPLGMEDTAFWVPAEKRDRFAVLYKPEGTPEGSDAWLSAKRTRTIERAGALADRNFLREPPMPSGGGGLVSTAADYLRFATMMLNGGELDGVRLLSPKTVELMTADHMGEMAMPMNAGYGFGLGFAVSHGPGIAPEIGSKGEYNWGGAAGTRFWIDPEEQLIGIYMVQILPHLTTLGSEFKTLTYQAIVD